MTTITPAVTTAVQSTFVTGGLPRDHGIVANGWYFRDLAEVWFWRQANQLVGGEKVWEAARRRVPDFRCAQLFWWYNICSSADIAVTPRHVPRRRPQTPDIHTNPPGLRDELQKISDSSTVPFLGAGRGHRSSQWIGRCALHVFDRLHPTLTLCLPAAPRLQPATPRSRPSRIAQDVAAVDQVCGELIDSAQRAGARVIALSEYGITPVSNPVHINRALRQAGYIQVREELGHELLDAGASRAFAVADHQVAHIYVAEPALVPQVKALVESLPGVERVLDEAGKREHGLDHRRSGELVAVARADSWFTYYYFLDDDRAPDFARTVNIHRKPGYDPVELFIDPQLRLAKARIAWKLARKILGFRYMMDVISLDARLVKGSHGRPPTGPSTRWSSAPKPGCCPRARSPRPQSGLIWIMCSHLRRSLGGAA